MLWLANSIFLKQKRTFAKLASQLEITTLRTGITGVYIFSTPLLSPDLWIIYFSSPFVLVSLLAQKVFLASRPWKYLLYFFVRVFVEFSPLAVEILFFLKQAARLSSQGQYHKQKKHTPWEKKSKGSSSASHSAWWWSYRWCQFTSQVDRLCYYTIALALPRLGVLGVFETAGLDWLGAIQTVSAFGLL